VTGEGDQDRAEGRVRAGDRVGLGGDRALDLGRQPVRGGLDELAEDRLLGREVEVDAALARLRGRRDLIDGRVALAASAERVERGVEDLLAPRPAPLRLRRRPTVLLAHRLA